MSMSSVIFTVMINFKQIIIFTKLHTINKRRICLKDSFLGFINDLKEDVIFLIENISIILCFSSFSCVLVSFTNFNPNTNQTAQRMPLVVKFP